MREHQREGREAKSDHDRCQDERLWNGIGVRLHKRCCSFRNDGGPGTSNIQQPPAESPAPRAGIPVTHGVDPSQIPSEKLPGPKAVVGNDKQTEVTGSSNTTAAQQARMATPWGVAADAGVTVGKSSQKAAVATAGFFNRFGKSIAKVF